MFTGIIQSLGKVQSRRDHSLVIEAALSKVKPGDSVAVNGACLTVTPPIRRGLLCFDVSDETWRLTNLGRLEKGMAVNLEPALRAGDALGGHLVSGHVDACGKVLALDPLANGFARLRLALPGALRGLLALKGSVAVNGVSLTVTAVYPESFETVLVPHTLKNTNLFRLKKGDLVNLEADLIARYVAAALAGSAA